MPNARKKAAAPEAPVMPLRSETVYEIFHVHQGGAAEATRTPAPLH